MPGTASEPTLFQQLIWRDDRMLLGDLTFRLQHTKDDAWELGDECFVFYKIKPLIDQYERFWSARPDFRPRNVFELGMWDGGSVAFWFELFQPRKHVGLDFAKRDNSPYFKRYLASRGLEQRIATHWGVDQADAARIQAIVRKEFDGPLDLILDDASHMYRPTKASFETLFPLLRPGGLYVIEDWAWAHWKEFQTPNHPWAAETALTRLIFELVAATGSSADLIARVEVFQGFVAVERGPISINERFELDRFISNRPRMSIGRRLARSAKRFVKRRLQSVGRR
jgi:SAM-dependent methyltransferase